MKHLLILAAILVSHSPILAQKINVQEAEEVIDQWVELWATYDLDLLDNIFWKDPRCSYFSSEKEGLIEGYQALIPHHEGFGFVPGGKTPARQLWLEEARFQEMDQTILVTATWYFGEKSSTENNQRGPVTFLIIKDQLDKAKIAHTHFANY